MLLAAALISGAAVAVPAIAAHPDDVRRCVTQNLVKYSAPDRAAVAQYVDVEAACRAALDGEATGGIVIAADPAGGAPPAERGEGGVASPGSDDGTGSSGGAAGSGGDGTGSDRPGAGGGEGAGAPAAGGEAGEPSEVLEESLRQTAADAGGPGFASGAPTWLVLLIGALVAGGIAATAMGRSRPSR